MGGIESSKAQPIKFTKKAGNYAIDGKGWYYQKGADGKWHPLRSADQAVGKSLFEKAQKAEQAKQGQNKKMNPQDIADSIYGDIRGIGTKLTLDKHLNNINEKNAAQVLQAYKKEEHAGENFVEAIDNEWGLGEDRKIKIFKDVFNKLKLQAKNKVSEKELEDFSVRMGKSIKNYNPKEISKIFNELSNLITDSNGVVNDVLNRNANLKTLSQRSKTSSEAHISTDLMLKGTIRESNQKLVDYKENEHSTAGQIWSGLKNIVGSSTSVKQLGKDLKSLQNTLDKLSNLKGQEYVNAFEAEFGVEYNPKNIARVAALKKQLPYVEGYHFAEESLKSQCELLLKGQKLSGERSGFTDSRGFYHETSHLEKNDVFKREFTNFVNFMLQTQGINKKSNDYKEKYNELSQQYEKDLNQYETLDEKWSVLQNMAKNVQNGFHSALMKSTGGISYEQYQDNVTAAYDIAFGKKTKEMRAADEFIASQRAGEGYVKMAGKIALTMAVGALTGGTGALMLTAAGISAGIDVANELSRGNKGIKENAKRLARDPEKIGEIVTEAAVAAVFVGQGSAVTKFVTKQAAALQKQAMSKLVQGLSNSKALEVLKGKGLSEAAAKLFLKEMAETGGKFGASKVANLVAGNKAKMFATHFFADMATAAGTEVATTGTITKDGMIFAVAFSLTGHLIGMKQLSKQDVAWIKQMNVKAEVPKSGQGHTADGVKQEATKAEVPEPKPTTASQSSNSGTLQASILPRFPRIEAAVGKGVKKLWNKVTGKKPAAETPKTEVTGGAAEVPQEIIGRKTIVSKEEYTAKEVELVREEAKLRTLQNESAELNLKLKKLQNSKLNKKSQIDKLKQDIEAKNKEIKAQSDEVEGIRNDLETMEPVEFVEPEPIVEEAPASEKPSTVVPAEEGGTIDLNGGKKPYEQMSIEELEAELSRLETAGVIDRNAALELNRAIYDRLNPLGNPNGGGRIIVGDGLQNSRAMLNELKAKQANPTGGAGSANDGAPVVSGDTGAPVATDPTPNPAVGGTKQAGKKTWRQKAGKLIADKTGVSKLQHAKARKNKWIEKYNKKDAYGNYMYSGDDLIAEWNKYKGVGPRCRAIEGIFKKSGIDVKKYNGELDYELSNYGKQKLKEYEKEFNSKETIDTEGGNSYTYDKYNNDNLIEKFNNSNTEDLALRRAVKNTLKKRGVKFTENNGKLELVNDPQPTNPKSVTSEQGVPASAETPVQNDVPNPNSDKKANPLKYEYDTNGNLKTIELPNGRKVTIKEVKDGKVTYENPKGETKTVSIETFEHRYCHNENRLSNTESNAPVQDTKTHVTKKEYERMQKELEKAEQAVEEKARLAHEADEAVEIQVQKVENGQNELNELLETYKNSPEGKAVKRLEDEIITKSQQKRALEDEYNRLNNKENRTSEEQARLDEIRNNKEIENLEAELDKLQSDLETAREAAKPQTDAIAEKEAELKLPTERENLAKLQEQQVKANQELEDAIKTQAEKQKALDNTVGDKNSKLDDTIGFAKRHKKALIGGAGVAALGAAAYNAINSLSDSSKTKAIMDKKAEEYANKLADEFITKLNNCNTPEEFIQICEDIANKAEDLKSASDDKKAALKAAIEANQNKIKEAINTDVAEEGAPETDEDIYLDNTADETQQSIDNATTLEDLDRISNEIDNNTRISDEEKTELKAKVEEKKVNILEDEIAKAKTEEELNAIVQKVNSANLSNENKKKLMDAINSRKAELSTHAQENETTDGGSTGGGQVGGGSSIVGQAPAGQVEGGRPPVQDAEESDDGITPVVTRPQNSADHQAIAQISSKISGLYNANPNSAEEANKIVDGIKAARTALRRLGPFKGRKQLRRMLKDKQRQMEQIAKNNVEKVQKYKDKAKEHAERIGTVNNGQFEMNSNVQQNMQDKYDDKSDKKKAKIKHGFGL